MRLNYIDNIDCLEGLKERHTMAHFEELENLEILYAALVAEAKDYRITKGHNPSGFAMLEFLDDLRGKTDRDSLQLIRRLHAEGYTTD